MFSYEEKLANGYNKKYPLVITDFLSIYRDENGIPLFLYDIAEDDETVSIYDMSAYTKELTDEVLNHIGTKKVVILYNLAEGNEEDFLLSLHHSYESMVSDCYDWNDTYSSDGKEYLGVKQWNTTYVLVSTNKYRLRDKILTHDKVRIEFDDNIYKEDFFMIDSIGYITFKDYLREQEINLSDVTYGDFTEYIKLLTTFYRYESFESMKEEFDSLMDMSLPTSDLGKFKRALSTGLHVAYKEVETIANESNEWKLKALELDELKLFPYNMVYLANAIKDYADRNKVMIDDVIRDAFEYLIVALAINHAIERGNDLQGLAMVRPKEDKNIILVFKEDILIWTGSDETLPKYYGTAQQTKDFFSIVCTDVNIDTAIHDIMEKIINDTLF